MTLIYEPSRDMDSADDFYGPPIDEREDPEDFYMTEEEAMYGFED